MARKTLDSKTSISSLQQLCVRMMIVDMPDQPIHIVLAKIGVGQLRDKLFPRATTEPGYKLSPGEGRPGSVTPGDG